MIEDDLTRLTDVVMLAGHETTILAEVQQHRAQEFTGLPTFTTASNNPPPHHYQVCIWNGKGETATYQISVEDFRYLRSKSDAKDGHYPRADEYKIFQKKSYSALWLEKMLGLLRHGQRRRI